VYLAAKTGRFMPRSVRARYEVLQWLMFQMGGVGPMLGQAHHFRIYAPEKIAYAIDRYTNEARRLYGVLERRLTASGGYLGGRHYSIADIATWPWVRSHANQGVDLADYPQVARWFETIGARPAVRRAITVLADRRKPVDDKGRETLFGATQYARR
jgi:GST-like protein